MSDVNDKSAIPGAVNPETVTGETPTTDKVDPVLAEKDNLLKALHQERSERKELKKKLEEFEASEKARKEKELAEQGKYKELLESKEVETKTFKEQLDSMSKEIERYREVESKKLESIKAQAKEKLGESKFATIEKLLQGKSTFEQMELLPELVNSIIPQSTNTIPTNNAGISTKDTAEYESLLKNGDIFGALNSKKY